MNSKDFSKKLALRKLKLQPVDGPTKTDLPKKGQVILYRYLFDHEQRAGNIDGSKTRPAIVLTANPNEVRVAAITQSTNPEYDTIKLPDDIAKACGVSNKSYVVISERNGFQWIGPDVEPIKGRFGNVYGRMPIGFFTKLLGLIEDSRIIRRDDEP